MSFANRPHPNYEVPETVHKGFCRECHAPLGGFHAYAPKCSLGRGEGGVSIHHVIWYEYKLVGPEDE